MCTNKIIVRNNSRYIVPSEHVALYRFCNCGQCAECMQNKINEYTLRLHYHAKECFARKGYVYIDCLTYENKYLPRLGHFFDLPVNYSYKCFSHEDVRLFFVRLRSYLSRLGYSKDAFGYFYVGEFGSRNTKRPHYHVVFFVYADIAPAEFSIAVSKCWYLGRTDGLAYSSRSNLDYNTITPGAGNPKRIAAISTYIAKYLNKSLKLIRLAERKTMNVIFYKYGVRDLKSLNYEQRLFYRSVFRRFMPFHRQSLGFGLYALNCVDMEYINKYQKIYFDNGDKKFVISLPLYFVRKLYFTLEKNSFGGYSWIPNQQYVDILKARFEKSVDDASLRLRALCETYNVTFPMDYKDFVICLKYVFGRTNFTSVNESFEADLSRSLNVSVLKPGFYNYMHPRFGLSVLSNKPLVMNHVKLEVVVTKRLKKHWNLKYKKVKFLQYVNCQFKNSTESQNGVVYTFQDFASHYLQSSELYLKSTSFYDSLRVFILSFCRNSIQKKKAQDLKITIKQTFNLLNHARLL